MSKYRKKLHWRVKLETFIAGDIISWGDNTETGKHIQDLIEKLDGHQWFEYIPRDAYSAEPYGYRKQRRLKPVHKGQKPRKKKIRGKKHKPLGKQLSKNYSFLGFGAYGERSAEYYYEDAWQKHIANNRYFYLFEVLNTNGFHDHYIKRTTDNQLFSYREHTSDSGQTAFIVHRED
jgi:hypothetical protein